MKITIDKNSILRWILLVIVLLITGCATTETSILTESKVSEKDIMDQAIDDTISPVNKDELLSNAIYGNQNFIINKGNKLKVMQIWLDSHKTIKEKIKEFLAEINDEDIANHKSISSEEKIIGEWYGLSKNKNEPMNIQFNRDMKFTIQSNGELKKGVYQLVIESGSSYIEFHPDGEKNFKNKFDFINQTTLLLVQGEDNQVLIKKRQQI